MSQGFDQTQIEYLMVFLKDTPSIGLEEFETQFISSASFEPSGSGQTRLYREHFGEDTKIKVLVTGEIELNEKNVFLGLKMAFPEWESELFPMSMQKLILQDSGKIATRDAGVVATIEPKVKMEKAEWLEPCVFNLTSKGFAGELNSKLEGSFLQETTPSASDVPQLEEQLEQFKDIWSRNIYEDKAEPNDNKSSGQSEVNQENIEASLDEIFSDITGSPKEYADSALREAFSDVPGFSDKQNDLSFEEAFNDFPSYDPDSGDSFINPGPAQDLSPLDDLAGADSEAILDEFGERKSLWPFTESLEDEVTGSSYLDEGTGEPVHRNALAEEENTLHVNPFLPKEDLRAAQDFNGSKHEIKIMGVVGEGSTSEARTSADSNDAFKNLDNLWTRLRENGQDLINNLSNKIHEIPTQRISKFLLILGVFSVVLAFSVTFIEPDFDATRKAAGVVNIYEWIIANDMLGEETDVVFDTWKETAEFTQFWTWHDSQWLPKITIFNTIKGLLRNIGALMAISGLLLFAVTYVVKRIPSGFNDVDEESFSFSGDKRISLNFRVYNDAWSILDNWSKENGFKILEAEGCRKLLRKAGTASYPPTLCMLACDNDQVELEVWMTTRIPTKLIPILSDLGIDALEAKNTTIPPEIKEQINTLLIRLGHPPLA